MTASGFAVAVLTLWLFASGTARWLALRALAREVASGNEPCDARGTPLRVLLLRPLRGAGAALEDCLESLFRSAAAAGARVRLGFADPHDPAGAVVERVRKRWPALHAELRVAPGPPGRNPKIANLVQMLHGAEADVFVASDADIRVPEDYVSRVARAFEDPAVGFATCPYRSVPARGATSRLDALVTTTHFLPNVCLALGFEGLHFGLGGTVAVRDRALAAIGGFEALLSCAADDYELARRVEEGGYRLAWVPLLLDHVLEKESWRRVARRHLRWARVARSVRRRGYLGLIVTHGFLPALLLGVAGGAGGALAGLPLLLWWGGELAALWPHRRRLGLGPRDLMLVPVADVLAFLFFAGGLLGSARPPD